MHVVRIETALRLLLLSMTLAVLSASIPVIAAGMLTGGSSATNASAIDAYWIHTVVLPGIALSLVFGCALSGVVAVGSIESNRGRSSPVPRTWDSARVAALSAFLAGAFILISGIVLGLVYIPEHQIVSAIRIAAAAAIGSGVGLYLLWTAERMGGSRTLSRVALLLGFVSVGLAASASAAVLLGASFADPIEGGLLAVSVPATGILSLLAWVVVYAGILGRFRSTAEPSPVPGGA